MVAVTIFVMALGVLFLVSALANWDWYKGIVDFAAVEGLFGENAARWLCGLFGLVLIGLGVVGLFQRS
jgi:threonine/homoserine/homoserine lactone efflux protein